MLGENYLDGYIPNNGEYFLRKNDVLQKLPCLKNDVSLLRFFIIKSFLLAHGYSNNISIKISRELVEEFIRVRSIINVSCETINLLKELSCRYKLVTISNGNADVELTPLSKIFLKKYYSNINIKSKPDKAMFELVIKDFNIDKRDLCHIGDDEITDVFGAINAGALSVRVTKWHRDNTKMQVLPHVEVNNINEISELL